MRHPVFENGKSKGTLRIENPPGNNYNIRVRIVKDEDQKEIYYSEGIRPGQVIKEDHLDEALKKGAMPVQPYSRHTIQKQIKR
ncbi:MAG: hypothetical protein ACLTDX_19695 [[Clostridium] innocuum]